MVESSVRAVGVGKEKKKRMDDGASVCEEEGHSRRVGRRAFA